MKSIYLERYAWPEPVLSSYNNYSEIDCIVVIPAYNELNLEKTLDSLGHCHAPGQKVLVIVVINEPEDASVDVQARNKLCYDHVKKFHASWFQLEAVHLKLPKKKAGVGLARKIGMDEAVRIFNKFGKEGTIVCFDADCTCDQNYFLAIEKFYKDQNNNLGLVFYEHPLNGNHPTEIINYELFLRYYIDALRFSGYPNAVQTLGSCITVNSKAYEKQGGMNTRKAGEDFYFIHKIVPLGGIGEINNTCIYPSDRISDRVPFGTGHAIGKLIQQGPYGYETYNPAIFQDLKIIFSTYKEFYKGKKPKDLALPDSVVSFYEKNLFERDLGKIMEQSNTIQNFEKRFYAWWNAFQVLKFIHHSRDNFHPNVGLHEATDWLNEVYFKSNLQDKDLKEKLLTFRQKDRQSDFYIK